jgi:metallopeptidase MepB
MRDDLFQLVDTVFSQEKDLPKQEAYYLKKLHQDFVQNGIAILPGAARDRYNVIKKTIDELTSKVRNSLNGDTSGIWLTKEELKGLPEEFIARLPVEKQEDNTDNKKSEPAHVWIRMKDPDTLPISKYASNPETRRKVHLAHQNRCPENRPLYTEIFALRREAAQILGYSSHAEFRIKSKMVGSAGYVNKFLGEIREKSQNKRDDSVQIMREMKKTDLQSRRESSEAGEKLYPWDKSYYDRIMKEEQYDIDQNEVAEYYPLEHTLPVMFKVYEHMFGVRVSELSPEKHWTWHDSVKMYAAWDTDTESEDKFLGFLYLDLFPRDGKYTHAGHFGLAQVRFILKSVDEHRINVTLGI